MTFESELLWLASIPYLERGFAGKPAAVPWRNVTDQSFDHATSCHFRSLVDHDYYQSGCLHHARFLATRKEFWERVVVHDIGILPGS